MFKQQKGITLIALVITIIVLLILAGVTIAMLTGSDNAPSKAARAKALEAIGEGKDAVTLYATNEITNYYNDKYVKNVDSEYNDVQAAALSAVDATANGVTIKAEGTDAIRVEYKADKDNYYSIGSVDSKGAITWEDHFVTEE